MHYCCKLGRLCLLPLVILIVWVIPAGAQSANYIWSRAAGGSGNDLGYSIEAKYPGCVYIAGVFSVTFDADPGPGTTNLVSAGAVDGYIIKLDTAGAFIWARQISGAGGQTINSVTVDTSGRVYIVGQHSGTTDLDPGASTHNVTSNGSTDIFIVQLDSAGNLIWGKSIGGSGADFGNAIVVDTPGNIYVTGSYKNTVDFDPGPGTVSLTYNGGTLTNDGDVFLAKFDNAGGLIWANGIGGPTGDICQSLVLDHQGDIIMTGTFTGTTDFDPGPGTVNLTTNGTVDNQFVAKYTTLGSLLWAKNFGGPGGPPRQYVNVDLSGNILVAGQFYDTKDFDPGPGVSNLTSDGASDMFVLKLDGSGNLIWVRRVGGTAAEIACSVNSDAFGNVYVSGTFGSTEVDFDPGSNVLNLQRATSAKNYVLKLDGTGGLVWARKLGGGMSSLINVTAVLGFMSLDAQANIYLAGTFFHQEPVDFDPGPAFATHTNAGSADVYAVKLKQSGCGAPSFTVGSLNVCDSISLGGDVYNTSGNYSVIFPNASGCDSISNIAITITNSSSSTHLFTACDSFTFNGNTYTSSGNYLDTFINAVACDSIVELKLTILHSSFDTLVHSDCDSFVLNGTAYYTTGYHTQNYTAANGCDSFVVLDLTILKSLDTISQSACDSFVYNSTSYSSSGFYQHSFTSVNNCDSIIVLDLTINTVDVTVTNTGSALSAGALGATYQWIDCNGFVPIPGESNQTYVYAQSGSYAVIVTQNGCIDTSVCITVNDVKVIGPKDADLNLYPNPTQRFITIASSITLEKATLRIRNLEGRTLQTLQKVNGSNVHINIEDLQPGVYFVEIEMDNVILRRKFVKL